MTARKGRCRAKNASGEACGAPERVVNPETGFCPAHRPGGRTEMQRRGLKGAIASRKAKGLDAEDLGHLETPRDAERWLRTLAQAVASGRLGPREGDVAARAVRTWLEAHRAGKMAEEVAELRAQVAALRKPRAVP